MVVVTGGHGASASRALEHSPPSATTSLSSPVRRRPTSSRASRAMSPTLSAVDEAFGKVEAELGKAQIVVSNAESRPRHVARTDEGRRLARRDRRQPHPARST